MVREVLTEETWKINPKIREWIDMFRSWGITEHEAFEMVLQMWETLPLDIRLEKGKEELK